MDRLSIGAPAKLNLTLRVNGLRPDGYHEIESLTTQIRLWDRLSGTLGADGRITLRCDDPALPTDERNLAVRAAQELAQAASRPVPGADLQLEKSIPAGAGLGGGSSDAASTLMMLNRLWSLGLGMAALAAIGARIGSDVPLFLAGPSSILRGRGVELEPVAAPVRGWAVLALPEIHSATAAVYGAWDRLGERPVRPPLNEIVRRLGDGPAALMPLLFNDLEAAAHAVSPHLADFAARLRGLSSASFLMSGSGSAYFSLVDDEAAARALADQVREKVDCRVEAKALVIDPRANEGRDSRASAAQSD